MPGGRPKFVVPWDIVDEMCANQSPATEIAGVIGCHVDTLKARCQEDHGVSFSDYFAVKRQKGLNALRNKQLELAMAGDKTMLVWLGKQYLAQQDQSKVETDNRHKHEGTVKIYMPDNGRGDGS
jgi:hypothetical protein